MDDILPEHSAGPGKLRIFTTLLTLLVFALVIGSAISVLYNVDFVENIAMWAAKHPFLIFELAGIIAIISLVLRAISYADDQNLL